jgi:hypothetical protein
MRRPAVIPFTMALCIGLAANHATFAAAKAGKAGAVKGAKGAKGSAKGAAPPTEELAKLKAISLGDPKAGIFTWGMSSADVIAKSKAALKLRYQQRIDAAKSDSGKQHRIEQQRDQEMAAVEKSYTKFEGQKGGWDVSIIDAEFAQGNGESMLPLKEDIWTRYFFFIEDRLWKIFLAFNKDAIGTKSFRDFGKEMATKYGAPREVFRDEKQKGGVKRTLDHFEWAVSGEDSLKLVDRSQFYDVYCLVLSDAAAAERIVAKRKITNPGTVEKDSLVDAIVNSKDNGVDSNDDIIDRVTGHEVKKPGSENKHGDIAVPLPGAVPSAAEPSKAGKDVKKDKMAKEPQEKKPAGSGLEL